MHSHLLHNSEIRKLGEALLCPGQVGFMNGWGVFSTLRVYGGILFAFERHYERLTRDAARMHVPFAIPAPQLEQTLLRLVRANKAENATLRVAIIRNKGGPFEDPHTKRDSDLIAFTADLSNWGDGVRLSYQPHGRHAASPFAGTKFTSWAQNLTWYEEAHQRGFDEVILLNENGQISECTSANIFAIQGDHVWTPPLESSGCLSGVTRAILLDQIHVPGLTLSEADLTPCELEDSDQVFITSTTRDLLPVLEIDHHRLPQSRDVLRVLQNAFCKYRDDYAETRSTRQSEREETPVGLQGHR